MKYTLSVVFIVAVFLTNPLWGCGLDDEPDFQFGQNEMAEYVGGVWKGDVRASGGEVTSFEIRLEADDAPTTTEQKLNGDGSCGTTREFLRAANACDTTPESILQVRGEITSGDGEFHRETVDGDFAVYGEELTEGTFVLFIRDFALIAECDDQFRCLLSTAGSGAPPEFLSMAKELSQQQ